MSLIIFPEKVNMLWVRSGETKQVELGLKFAERINELALEPGLLIVQFVEHSAKVAPVWEQAPILARHIRQPQSIRIKVVVGPRAKILPEQDRARVALQFVKLRKHGCIRGDLGIDVQG